MDLAKQFKIFEPAQAETITVAELTRRLREASEDQGVTHVYLGHQLYAIYLALDALRDLDPQGQVYLAPTFTVSLPERGGEP